MLVLVAVLAGAVSASPAKRPVRETVAAVEESYRCLAKTKEEGAAACQNALARGVAPWRAEVLRQALALKLVGLVRFDEAVEVYRESARALPADAKVQLRLGSALLYLGSDAETAEGHLRDALRLDPQNPEAHATLAQALASLGRLIEARASFDEAARLDPTYFDHRPAARATYEAVQRGTPWP